MVKYRNIRLHHLFDKIIPGSILLFPILLLLFMVYKILHNKGDGWRKTTAVFHRKIPSRYIGVIKNIRLPNSISEENTTDYIIEKLHLVFSCFKTVQTAVRWEKWHSYKVVWEFVDFSKFCFSKNGINLKFIPDKNFPLNKSQHQLVRFFESRIIELMPKTDSNPPVNWPYKLRRKLVKQAFIRFSTTELQTIELVLNRILSSVWITECCVNNESLERTFFAKNVSPGFSNFFCTVSVKTNNFDLWMQINHISMDGRTSTECLKRIVKIFGQSNLSDNIDEKISRKIDSSKVSLFKQEFDEGITSIDLSNFFEIHSKFESQFGRINPVALLAWSISSHPFFNNTKFNIPVDIPATISQERTVGFVFIRPGYFQQKYEFPISFEKYMAFFNSQFQQVRKRKGANFIMVDSAVVVHPIILNLFFKIFPKSLEEVIGGTCLTFLKGIDTALPPLSDNINSGMIFSLSNNPENKISNIGIRSFKLNSGEILKNLSELFCKLNKYLDNKSC